MSTGSLWEREAAVAAVSAALDGACDGRGVALLVEGEAGLGKTAVLERAQALARERGMEVAAGRGEDMERAVPFGLVGRALAAAEGLPGTAGAGDSSVVEPGAPFYRTLRWLQERRGPPLLIALDDLQWADADSLALIAFVARRLGGLPIALVATMRPWPPQAHDVAEGLVAAGVARAEHLEPLSPGAVAELLRDRSGRAVGHALAAHAHEQCRGNPLLLEQFARAVARREVQMRGGDATLVTPEHLLLARFAGLDPAGLRWVQAASVLGACLRAEVTAEVAELSAAEVEDVLQGLWRSGLVVQDAAGSMRFAHPLFARAVYDDLAAPIRARLHARCLRALARRGLDAEAAEHALRAELVGDPESIAVLERAGRRALEAGAVATAAGHLEAAVRLSGDRPTPLLAVAVAEALFACGRAEETIGRCQAILREDDVPWTVRVDVLRLLGRALYLTGARDHGGGALAEAASIAVAHGAPTRAVQPLLDQSLSAWLAGGPALALPLAQRARELAADAPADLRVLAEVTWAQLAYECGDPSGIAAADAAADILDERGVAAAELSWPWATLYQVAMNQNYRGRYDEAIRVLAVGRQEAERAGAASAVATLAIHLAHVAVRAGRLDEALHEAHRAEEVTELAPGIGPYARLAHAEALLWLGRLDDSEDACSEAEAMAGGQWYAELWAAHMHGLRQLWQGDPAAAQSLTVAEELTHVAGIREPCAVQWGTHAVAAHLAAGDPDSAARVVTWLEDCAGHLPCAWPRLAATLGRALLEAQAGDDEDAEEGFRAALASLDDAGLPLLRVETLLAYGEFLRRRARPVHARPRLAEALGLAESCGAAWLAQTAHDELLLAGGRRRRGGERGGLTSAEQRVADLAARGSSNAEIARRLHLSVNTVETHLKRVYAKLGLRSRRDLMRDRSEA